MRQRTILITGCGPSGIGANLAKQFQLRGHRVIATGLKEDLLAPLADLGMETLIMDVTSQDSIDAALREVRRMTSASTLTPNTSFGTQPGEAYGRDDGDDEALPGSDGYIDMLINNAGLLQILPFADTPVSEIRKVFDVNIVGAMLVTRAFIPLLVAGAARSRALSSSSSSSASVSAGQNQSIIANTCSINSDLRPPFLALYNASKAALDVFGSTIRTELAPLGIRVVSLKTGAIQTELFNHSPPSVVPEGSYYQAALGTFLGERRMFEGTTMMDGEVYAKSVVGSLCKGWEGRGGGGWFGTGWGWGAEGGSVSSVIWEGNLVGLAWVVRAVRWDWFWDWVFIKGNKLDTVKPPTGVGIAGSS